MVSIPSTKVKVKTSGAKKFRCPECKRIFKSKKSVEQHMKDKKHIGKIQSTPSKVKEKPKPKPKPAPEPEPEPEPEVPLKMWCRLAEENWLQVKEVCAENLEPIVCPLTDNFLIAYTDLSAWVLDYWMFIFDFVEIEMEIGDVIYALSEMDRDFILDVKDIATLKITPILGVITENGAIITKSDKGDMEEELLIGQLQALLSTQNPRALASVSGYWKPPPKKVKSSGYGWQSQHGHWSYHAEDEFEAAPVSISTGMQSLLNPKRKPIGTPPAPPRPPVTPPKRNIPAVEFKRHPIYKVSEAYIYTDRIVDFSIYV